MSGEKGTRMTVFVAGSDATIGAGLRAVPFNLALVSAASSNITAPKNSPALRSGPRTRDHSGGMDPIAKLRMQSNGKVKQK
jgi:hypothetical protein